MSDIIGGRNVVVCGKCGSEYERYFHQAASRQKGKYICTVCGAVVDHWNSDMVPSYMPLTRRNPKE
ncbi:MAG: hypothetical protein AAGA32_14260 [Pseudomonadota bacterium]